MTWKVSALLLIPVPFDTVLLQPSCCYYAYTNLPATAESLKVAQQL